MIKVIVFDFGGVLVRTEDPAGRRQWEARLGLAAGELDRLVFNSDVALRATVGDVTGSAVWEHVAVAVKLTAPQLTAFPTDFWACARLCSDPRAPRASLRP